MNRLDCSVVHIARFSLQARSALSIGTGGTDGVFDHPIVRDANGLPLIPGTSLAGVLRHLWLMDHDKTGTDALFGFQYGSQGAASRLEVSACTLQDSQGRPVQGLLLGQAGERRLMDPLLGPALKTRDDPTIRDRVRITHRGVAKSTGKFDRGLLLAGHRFSGELRLWSEVKDDPDWPALLALLADPRLRLGGGTRAGLGSMELQQLSAGSFDLRQSEDRHGFAALDIDLGLTHGLGSYPLAPPPTATTGNTLGIALDPRDFWRIGQGSQSFRPITRLAQGKIPDLLPKQEAVVLWDDQGRARLSRRFALVPGSAVKGALAHRTAFHWNLLTSHFVEAMGESDLLDWDKSDHCPGVRDLFGYAKDKAGQPDAGVGASNTPADAPGTGRAGLVLIDDVHVGIDPAHLDDQIKTLIHNSIDRFTGGVRKRMLFTEEMVFRQPIQLRITLLPAISEADPLARRAFARALADLCTGRLALGAGTTKGHGSFHGQPDDHARAWMAAQGETLL